MAESAFLQVRVTPRAARDAVAGWQDGVLRVRLRAPAIEGRANEALRRFLGAHLGIAPGRIEIVSGAGGRQKRLRIDGLGEAALLRRLGAVDEADEYRPH